MKKTIAVISSLLLVIVISMSAQAQKEKVEKAAGKTADTTKKAAEKTADTTKSAGKKVAPKSDDDIQKCVTDKLAASATLKSLGLSAATSNSVVTLTGTVKASKDKKAAGKIAKDCGAKTVTNNVEAPVEKAAKPEKKDEKSESKEDKKSSKKSESLKKS